MTHQTPRLSSGGSKCLRSGWIGFLARPDKCMRLPDHGKPTGTAINDYRRVRHKVNRDLASYVIVGDDQISDIQPSLS